MTLHRTSDLEDGRMDILFYSIIFLYYIIPWPYIRYKKSNIKQIKANLNLFKFLTYSWIPTHTHTQF